MSHLVLVCFLLGALSYHGALPNSVGSADYDFPLLSLTPSGHTPIPVKRVEHTGSASIVSTLQKIARRRNPRVILNSPALQWKAVSWDLHNMSLTKWTTLNSLLALPVTNHSTACVEQPSVFYVHDEEGNGLIRLSASGSAAVEPGVVAEMSLQTFLATAAAAGASARKNKAAKLKGNARKEYRYLFSADYGALEEELQLQADTNWQDFVIRDVDCQVSKGGDCLTDTADDGPAPQLTMMQPGTALQARMSDFHTVRVQVQGSATYHLLPPHASAQPLHVYPSIHRCAGQAQIDVYAEGGATAQCEAASSDSTSNIQQHTTALFSHLVTPGARPMEVHSVRLRAGEVLYIPPYWMVHSESHSMSVILDVLSVSLEQRLLLPAWYTELPFDPTALQSTEQRIVSAQVFLVHILSRVHGISSVLKFATALYQSRFAALYPEDGLFMQRSTFQCMRDQATAYNDIVSKLDQRKIEAAATFIANQLNSPLFHYNITSTTTTASTTSKSVGITGTVTVAEAASSSRDSGGDKTGTTINKLNPQRGVKWLWLGNYIENLARWAMGDADQAVLFIRECLYMDGIIEIIEEVEGPGTVRMEPDEDA